VPYFRRLGISDFYLSPIFTATPGTSMATTSRLRRMNPDRRGAGFDRLAARLGASTASPADFVPITWAFRGAQRWWGRLECGRLSPYAAFLTSNEARIFLR